jgi:hypothetical protein
MMTKKIWLFKLDPKSRKRIAVQARTRPEAAAEVKRELGIRPKDRLPRGCSMHQIDAA